MQSRQHLSHHWENKHLKHIQATCKLKKSKCSFFKNELHYLGHLLTTNGIKPQTEKIKAISEMKPAKNEKGVREFFSMVGYYRKFISRFADAARAMKKLTRNKVKFGWTEECQIGFHYLKTCLTEAPILKYHDPFKRYVVFTDASDQAAAAVLTQEYFDEDGEVKEMSIVYLPANSLIHSLNGALLRKVMQFTMQSRNGDTILNMQKFC